MFGKRSDKIMMNIICVCCNMNKWFLSKKVFVYVYVFDGFVIFYFIYLMFI